MLGVENIGGPTPAGGVRLRATYLRNGVLVDKEDATDAVVVEYGENNKELQRTYLTLGVKNAAADQPRDPDGKFAHAGATEGGKVYSIKHGSLSATFSVHRDKDIDGPHLPLANIKQKDDHTCGFVAALTVAKHLLGGDVSAKEVLKAVRPTKAAGIGAVGMRRALKELGVDTQKVKDLSIADLKKHIGEGTPVMVTVYPKDWSSDHWTVVQGFSADGKKVHLTNHRSMSVEDFKSEWFDKGEGIVCRKRATS